MLARKLERQEAAYGDQIRAADTRPFKCLTQVSSADPVHDGAHEENLIELLMKDNKNDEAVCRFDVAL